MNVFKNEAKRIVEIWLTNADQQNAQCMAFVDFQINVWKEQKYLPVVFRSGKENLEENTYTMLKYNRERMARREMEYEKIIMKIDK